MSGDLTQTSAPHIASLLGPGEQLLYVIRTQLSGEQYRDGNGKPVGENTIWGTNPYRRNLLLRILLLPFSLIFGFIGDILGKASTAVDGPAVALKGDPVSVARSLPAELVPHRRPRGTYTVLALTSARALILLVDGRQGNAHRLLWQVGRDGFGLVRLASSDMTVTFPDGSSARLYTWPGRDTQKLAAALGSNLHQA